MLSILLDQNIPRAVKEWLSNYRPQWRVYHATEVGLEGQSDEQVYQWAQLNSAVIVTFDQDFADQRSFASRDHAGIIRLRIWPINVEGTQQALLRLFSQVEAATLEGALVILDQDNIRIRFRK